MNILKDFKWTPVNTLKVVGFILIAIVVLTIAFKFVSTTISPFIPGIGKLSVSTRSSAPAVFEDAYYDGEDSAYGIGGGNNIGIPYPQPGGTIGGDAEDFEVTEYNATIETRDRDTACVVITDLKKFQYVVFENANEYDKGCNFTFKVEHAYVAELLAVIEDLNPKDISENVYTIQRQIENVTSEAEILQNKLDSINQTLKDALSAYDEVTELATRTQDVSSLTKIIDSKIDIISRLTQERINISAQLERLERSKAQQLDRLVYTYFNVSVYENKFVDGTTIKESWKRAVQGAVSDINRAIQDISVNLLAFLFTLIQYVIYLFIIVFTAKYLWKAVKGIWNR